MKTTIEDLNASVLEHVRRTGREPTALAVTPEEWADLFTHAGEDDISARLYLGGIEVKPDTAAPNTAPIDERAPERPALDLRDDEHAFLTASRRCSACPHLSVLHVDAGSTPVFVRRRCLVPGCKCACERSRS